VKVRFVEVTQGDSWKSGIDWYLGKVQTTNSNSGGSGNTQPSAGTPGATTHPPSGSEALLTTGLRSTSGTNAEALPLLTGILADPQFRVVLHALEKRDGANLLNEGQVTTLSGRQASFQVIDVKTVVSGLKANITNNAAHYTYETTDVPFGTTLDVVSYVMGDGYTIQMTVTPTITEFLGYENPKDYVKYDANLKNVKLPLPKSRVRQTTTTATVWDGQTLVLGNLSDETVVSAPDGTKLRQPSSGTKKKLLLIFITPTIIDQAGNRVHNEPKDYYDDPPRRGGGS
jgi:type II secretory pathway component GspD/PulD (secretin)